MGTKLADQPSVNRTTFRGLFRVKPLDAILEDAEEPEPAHFVKPVEPEAVEAWIDPAAREYAAQHRSRFVHTLEITPAGDASKSVLEMGAYMQMTPALARVLEGSIPFTVKAQQ